MTTVTTTEAQATLPQLLASVALGEEVLITDGGLPVARLSKTGAKSLPLPAPAPEAEADEAEDRPWRGVFAIENPGEPYPGGKLQLPAEPLLPAQEPADILWDRLRSNDD